MSNIYLKFPTKFDEKEWNEYVAEYRQNDPTVNPMGYKNDMDYHEWLNGVENDYKGINLQVGRVPSSIYFLMSDERIVGSISIRHNIDTSFLSWYGGHIGYNVRPSERRKGYATTMLFLALEKCEELGLENVMISCKEDNIGSAKTIENNCGILNEIVFFPQQNCNLKKYWINVKDALNNQKIKTKK